MSKKQKPLVTTQQNTVDPMVSQMQQHTMEQTRDVLDPYFNKAGYGVAGLNADQNTAFEGMRGQLGGITPGDIQSWMNPYVQNVVDTTTGRIQRQGDEALNAVRGRQAAGSAFGGTGARAALEAVKTQERTQEKIAETTATLMSQGYSQAQATAIANENLQNTALTNVLGAGTQQQQFEQYKLDKPLQALQLLQQATPQQYSSTSTTTQPNTAPSPFQQVLGLAGTAAGAYLGGPMGASMGSQLGGMFSGYSPAQHPMAQPDLYKQPIGPGW